MIRRRLDDMLNTLWIRIDIGMWQWHRRWCRDCRHPTLTEHRCHCGSTATIQPKRMCAPCAHAIHPTCWCSVRPELADDIDNTR